MLSLLHQNHKLDAAALPNVVVAECDWGVPIAAPLPQKADVLLLAGEEPRSLSQRSARLTLAARLRLSRDCLCAAHRDDARA
jgi:hypothetical protein